MTRDRGLSPGVINELVAQTGFRKYFVFGGPEVDRRPLKYWAEQSYGWWVVEARSRLFKRNINL
jgi:hypothetical protein